MTNTSLAILSLLAVTACADPNRDNQLSAGLSGDSATGSTSGPGTNADTSAGTSSGTDPSTKLDVGPPDTDGPLNLAEVFGHSADTLFRVDAETNEVEIVGDFAGCTASIIDIALDANSKMYGTAYGSLWSIGRLTGECTKIADGSYPTSLSFVPAGTVDPDKEALVGFNEDEYLRIDTVTGEVEVLGTLTEGLRSSGDMVSIDGASWLTVTDLDACSEVDCIVEIDPATGAVITNYGPLPYNEVFGLAFWAGRAYGFSRGGELFEIQFLDGSVATTPIDIPVAPANLEFYGAGSTTSAPAAG